jgi:hypothetical protein
MLESKREKGREMIHQQVLILLGSDMSIYRDYKMTTLLV